MNHLKKSHKDFDARQEPLVDVQTHSWKELFGEANDSDNDGNNDDDDDEDHDGLAGLYAPPKLQIHVPEPVPEPPEKTWEEKEREIVENTMHTILEKDMDESETCTLCLDNMRKGDEITILGCLCKFHRACFDFYMSKDPPNACPVHHKY